MIYCTKCTYMYEVSIYLFFENQVEQAFLFTWHQWRSSYHKKRTKVEAVGVEILLLLQELGGGGE